MPTAVVLQPSFLPWRGYFDLIRRSDVFVFYDDVQYDKHGWRNRNRIKTAQGPRWLTVPVHAKGNTIDHTTINNVQIDWCRDWRRPLLEQIRHAYCRAPFYQQYSPLVAQMFSCKPHLLADFTIDTTVSIARLLGIEHTQFVRSSTLSAPGAKTDRLLEVLKQVGATHYISGPSARAYIDEEKFVQAGIGLEYIRYEYEPYGQLHPPYDPQVSIVDLLFMTGPRAPAFIRPAAQTVIA
ncbi:MAG TPA: WbqC family protein [Candidatus Baltobacteraceae bacterium]|nr:WbqC family protein [Candidatus Baltobacteraceae bacterium]